MTKSGAIKQCNQNAHENPGHQYYVISDGPKQYKTVTAEEFREQPRGTKPVFAAYLSYSLEEVKC